MRNGGKEANSGKSFLHEPQPCRVVRDRRRRNQRIRSPRWDRSRVARIIQDADLLSSLNAELCQVSMIGKEGRSSTGVQKDNGLVRGQASPADIVDQARHGLAGVGGVQKDSLVLGEKTDRLQTPRRRQP